MMAVTMTVITKAKQNKSKDLKKNRMSNERLNKSYLLLVGKKVNHDEEHTMRVMRERPPPTVFVNTSQPMLSPCSAIEEEKKKTPPSL